MKQDAHRQALDFLRKLETETSIYNLQILGVKVWWFVRIHFFVEMRNYFAQGKRINKSSKISFLGIFSKVVFLITSFLMLLLKLLLDSFIISRAPKKVDYIFLVDASDIRLQRKEGLKKHAFFGYFYDLLEGKKVALELPTRKSLSYMLTFGGIVTPSFYLLEACLKGLVTSIRNENIYNWEEFEKEFNASFGISDSSVFAISAIRRIIKGARLKIAVQLNFARKVVEKFSPKVIVEKRSYNSTIVAINYISANRQIPVIEVQHGLISSLHPGYQYFLNLECYVGRKPLPERILVFGRKFKEIILKKSNVFREQNVVVVGNPRLSELERLSEEDRKNVREKVRKEIKVSHEEFLVVFTSQPAYSTNLADFIRRFLELSFNSDYRICIKLHPLESRISNAYRSFGSRVLILDDKLTDLYGLLLASDVHCTVSSTVFLEAMKIGVLNIILCIPGYESVLQLIRRDDLLLADSPESFADTLINLRNNEYKKRSCIEKGKQLAKEFFDDLKYPERIIIQQISELREIK